MHIHTFIRILYAVKLDKGFLKANQKLKNYQVIVGQQKLSSFFRIAANKILNKLIINDFRLNKAFKWSFLAIS